MGGVKLDELMERRKVDVKTKYSDWKKQYDNAGCQISYQIKSRMYNKIKTDMDNCFSIHYPTNPTVSEIVKQCKGDYETDFFIKRKVINDLKQQGSEHFEKFIELYI